MSPHCADEVKYDVVKRVVERFTAMKEAGELIAGHPIVDLVTVNGIRIVVISTAAGTGLLKTSRPTTSATVSSQHRRLALPKTVE